MGTGGPLVVAASLVALLASACSSSTGPTAVAPSRSGPVVVDVGSLPDGPSGPVRRLVEGLDHQGLHHLVALGEDGRWTRMTRLVDPDGGATVVALSPDGLEGAVVDGGGGGVRIVSLESGVARPLPAGGAFGDGRCPPAGVDWVGEQLAGIDGCGRLYLLPVDGSGRRSPVWVPPQHGASMSGDSGVWLSPDGSLLAATYLDPTLADEAGDYRTVVVDRTGHLLRSLPYTLLAADPWTPDGAAVDVTMWRGSVHDPATRIDVRSGTAQVAVPRSRVQGAVVGREGDALLVARVGAPGTAVTVTPVRPPGGDPGVVTTFEGLGSIGSVETRPGR